MKHVKRLMAVMLALLLISAMAVSAWADDDPPTGGGSSSGTVHTSIDPDSSTFLTETLTVSDWCYLPKITYTLTLGEGSCSLYAGGFGDDDTSSADFSLGRDLNTALSTLSGETLATVVFGDESSGYYAQYTGSQEGQWGLGNYPRDIVGPDDYTLPYWLDGDTVAAINALAFDRACVVWFPIEKTVTPVNDNYFGTDLTDGNPTNHKDGDVETGTALVIFVPGTADGLGTPVVGVYALDEDWYEPTFDITGATMTAKIANYEDDYVPAVKNLTIGKTVAGSLGDYDRYFRFEVTLYGFGDGFNDDVLAELIDNGNFVTAGDNTVSTATAKYVNEIYDDDVPFTGFNNLNPADYVHEVEQSLSFTLTFWLKHGETITIQNIPDYVTAFDVYEIGGDDFYYEGYSVSYVMDEVTGATYGMNYDEWDDTYDRNVTFTNERDVTPPTGLNLQAAAPIAGVVIALGLGAVVLLGRRRRDDRT